jgi:CheY-like chemotaxis protein
VEDNERLRTSMERLLVFEGYAVTAALDGLDALELLQRDPLPCVVLLDLILPRMNGYAFLERLRADPRTALLPVVVTTASPWQRVPGAQVFVKPYNARELFACMRKHCEL